MENKREKQIHNVFMVLFFLFAYIDWDSWNICNYL
jgi:hypothetical protein